MIATIIIQGLIFSLVAIAVYLTSRVIKKDDLTTEGSFGLGSAVTALVLQHSLQPMLALVLACLAGALSGLVTGILHTRLAMNHLMAGLATTTACFSLSLALASANAIIDGQTTVFAMVAHFSQPLSDMLVVLAASASVLMLVRWLLRTEVGQFMRASGDNPAMVVALGKSEARYYGITFMLANSITALAGSLFVQWSGFFSITGSMGVLVTGLASLMLAELFGKKLSPVILASALGYQAILALSLALGVPPVWNNLIKALIMISLVAIAHLLASPRKGESRA